jgi:hypothetical protein
MSATEVNTANPEQSALIMSITSWEWRACLSYWFPAENGKAGYCRSCRLFKMLQNSEHNLKVCATNRANTQGCVFSTWTNIMGNRN